VARQVAVGIGVVLVEDVEEALVALHVDAGARVGLAHGVGIAVDEGGLQSSTESEASPPEDNQKQAEVLTCPTMTRWIGLRKVVPA
jgi:hypothetical protein